MFKNSDNILYRIVELLFLAVWAAFDKENTDATMMQAIIYLISMLNENSKKGTRPWHAFDPRDELYARKVHSSVV